MQHPGARQVGGPQHGQGIGARLAGVDHQRQPRAPSRLEVQGEGALLDPGGVGLIVIVEAGLADGGDARMGQPRQQPVEIDGAALGGIQRMDAHGAVDVGIAFGQGLHRGGIAGIDADAEELADTPGARGIERCIQGAVMKGKIESIQVTVGVDEVHEK